MSIVILMAVAKSHNWGLCEKPENTVGEPWTAHTSVEMVEYGMKMIETVKVVGSPNKLL